MSNSQTNILIVRNLDSVTHTLDSALEVEEYLRRCLLIYWYCNVQVLTGAVCCIEQYW